MSFDVVSQKAQKPLKTKAFRPVKLYRQHDNKTSVSDQSKGDIQQFLLLCVQLLNDTICFLQVMEDPAVMHLSKFFDQNLSGIYQAVLHAFFLNSLRYRCCYHTKHQMDMNLLISSVILRTY